MGDCAICEVSDGITTFVNTPFALNLSKPYAKILPLLAAFTRLAPSYVKLASAFAVLVVPNDVRILLSKGFVIVLNPVPDVPELPPAPLTPEVPAVADVPLVPEVPLVPDVPLLPDVPEVAELPLVPELALVPDDPEDALVPLVALVPDDPLLPLVPEVPEVPLLATVAKKSSWLLLKFVVPVPSEATNVTGIIQ